MKPLAALTHDDVAPLRGLLFDLDDTLLSHGVLTREAYDAIWSLHEAGLRLVAVTGRPASWGELVARQWPIDAAITENGAIALVREGRSLSRIDGCDATERRSRRARLASIVERAREIVPEARLADDVDGRISDVAWDIGERVKLPASRVEALAEVVLAAGARTTRSSVHLHATFDTVDKASGVVRFLCDQLDEDAGAALVRHAYVGDSPNDAACFAAFHLTVGVANVRPYASRLSVPPRFVTEAPMGKGFAELARALIALRSTTQGAPRFAAPAPPT
ncbi:MAG: HAD-IIB family hydrolase [Polyangiaceae bacterium]